MQKTRSIVSLLAFTAFAFAAAGCGGGGGGGGTTAPIPGGGGGGGSATPTPPPATPTPPPGVTLSGNISVGDGITNGALAKFNPATGDSSTGGTGQAVDGITCDTVMHSTQHVHAFVGFMVNGQEYALPATIGMHNPSGTTGFVNSASCFYWLHTHDASGQLHVESPAAGNYTIGNLLDIWGQSSASIGAALGSSSFNVYVGYNTGTVDGSGNPIVNNYQPFTGDIRSLSLTAQRHPAIWFVVGNPTLPTVHFATEF